jgi:lysophospholipase L1-like esterase
MKFYRNLTGLAILVLAMIGLIGINVAVAAPATMPLISRNVPCFASSDYPASANDNSYSTSWRATIPGWITYDLSAVPVAQRGQVVLVWYDTDTYDYDHTPKSSYYVGIPKNYTIEGNAAAGGSSAPTSGWVALATVTGNIYHSRQTVVNLTGYNWIRLNISTLETQGGSNTCINVDVHDAGLGVQDDWIFYGDSITAGGMAVSGTNTFGQMINAAKPGYYPIGECGGIGGIFSWHGAQYINGWLAAFPGKYVGIAYGTNDAWGNQTGAAAYYTNIETIVKAVLAAGKVPIVSKIPFSTNADVANNVPSYNAQIDALYTAYPQVVKGPDFWTYFKNNPSLLGSDGVHPSDAGYIALRQQWANTALTAIYTGGTVTPTPTSAITPTPVRTPTPVVTTPTATPVITVTPARTPTPVRTATPRRTATPGRTATPRRTATPTPVYTASPEVTTTPVATVPVATATPLVTATPVPTAGSIKVQFYNQSTAATTNQIYLNIKLLNTGSSAISLSNVTIRYYYTIDGAQTQNFYCDWSPVGSSNVNGTFVTMNPAKTGADTYVEVGFGSGAGSLAAGGNTTVQARIAKSNWTNYTQTNDYSFNSSATTFVDWSKTAGFVSGFLQWGTEP